MLLQYSEYARETFEMKHFGKQRHNYCIKTIRVRWERGDEYLPTDFLLFSPDGTRVLSNSERGVCVWDATSAMLITGPLTGDDESDVLAAAFLPDGRYIIVASRDGIIRKWDILINSLVWERVTDKMQLDLSQVLSAEFSRSRNSIVFGDSQGTILVCNVDTGERDGSPLEGHTDSISCLSFSSDDKYLASGSDDTTIVIWNMDKRESRTKPLRGHTGRVTAVDFSPDGNTIISGSEDKYIYVWDVNSEEDPRKIICENGVDTVTYSPDGSFILAGGREWMSMWDVATSTPNVFRVDGAVWKVSFSLDGSRFVSGNNCFDRFGTMPFEGRIQIWDASWNVEGTKSAFKEQRDIKSIALSPSGELIASGSVDGSIYLWNVRDGELAKSLKFGCSINAVSFSPISGRFIVFGLDDGTVRAWDHANDKSFTIGNHKAPVLSVAFSLSNGKYLTSGSDDKTICIWSVKRRELAVGPLPGHEGSVLTVAYSPDGTRLVSGSYDKTVRVWDSATGGLILTLSEHSRSVSSVAYSLDGSYIVSGSKDNTIYVWDAQNGQTVCGPIDGYMGGVGSVCFSPNGKRILSGSLDNTARVWDALTGQPLLSPFSGHMCTVSSVCFFPDGRHFATGSYDGSIRIWTLDEVPNAIDWRLSNDNWVVHKNDKMMWIPTDLHRYLCGHRNISMLNRPFYLKLPFGTEQNVGQNIQFSTSRSLRISRPHFLESGLCQYVLPAFYPLFRILFNYDGDD